MKEIELEDWQTENIEDLIIRIEDSFNFRFEEDELCIENLKDLDSIVLGKIQKETDTLCTTQKVFYTLRNIFVKLNLSNTNEINTKTCIEKFIPLKNRRTLVKEINRELSFDSNILAPNKYILFSGILTFVFSIIAMYFVLKIGLLLCIGSILTLFLTFKYQYNLNFNNMRELVEDITENNYLTIRNKTNSINESEVKNIIRKWLSEAIDYEIKKGENVSFSFKTK